MADVVEQILERQIPSLQELVDRRIVTSEEVKAIVEQRRQHEYRLQRRVARKIDFVRYIQYEIKLDALRKLRKRRLQLVKNTDSDHAQIQHIFFIFERAVRKFQGDQNMFMQYIDYAVSQKAERCLSTLFPRAIQLHPRCAPLWIRAASWQYFELSNATAARVLLQRSLRINPRTRTLWVEYFRLEMLYVQKLGSRRDALGLDSAGGDFYDGAVPLAVFKNAVKNLPDVLEFRRNFLDVCTEFDGFETLARHILDSIVDDFALDPQAWHIRATYSLESGGGCNNTMAPGSFKKRRLDSAQDTLLSPSETESVSVYEQGVASLPGNHAMWAFYAHFLLELHALAAGDVSKSHQLQDMVDHVFERACDGRALTPAMCLQWARLPFPGRGPQQAARVVRKGLALHPTNIDLWQCAIGVERWCCQVHGAPEGLSLVVAEAFAALGPRIDRDSVGLLLEPLLELEPRQIAQSVAKGPPAVACQYLRWAHATAGEHGLRLAWAAVKEAFPGGSKGLIPAVVEYVSLETQPAMIRAAFETGIRSAPSKSLFAAYAAFERSCGDFTKADAVSWRSNEVTEDE